MKTDIEIQKNVIAELQWEPGLRRDQINVSVTEGVVMLSGIVSTYYKKVLAGNAARKVSGVKAVAEEMIVQIPGGKNFTDVDMTTAVLSALKWNSSINEKAISVKVEKAEVTLEGTCEWNFQKISVQKAIEDLVGIKNITNNIRVQNTVTASDIKDRISGTLEHCAESDFNKLNVVVWGDKVILTGTVRSYAEKMDVEKTAWLSPGVMEVDNRLSIDSEAGN